jgi:hypothetical protein
MLAGTALLRRGAGNDALRFGLTDALAGVGLDRLYRGEGAFFGAFLRHLCLDQIQIRELAAVSRQRALETGKSRCTSLANGSRVCFKIAPLEEANVKYFLWNPFIGVVGQWKSAIFSMRSRNSASTR